MGKKIDRREFLGLAAAGLATLASNSVIKDVSVGGEGVAKNRILNIYDNISNGGNEAIPDWGFSVFIQYNGKTILFDAGTHPEVLRLNAKALGADLTAVEMAILSHNHIDHLDGFDYLLKVNPDFKFFLPDFVILIIMI